MKFRKKPVVIEAMQLTADTEWESLRAFCPIAISQSGYRAMIPTLEGQMIADVGDWIIKGVKGEFYPCKPDIFAATYSSVDEEDAFPGDTALVGPLVKALREARLDLRELAHTSDLGDFGFAIDRIDKALDAHGKAEGRA